MKHCAALAQCYKTLTVAHRSRCCLSVAPLQPRDTEGDRLPGTGGQGGGGELCG